MQHPPQDNYWRNIVQPILAKQYRGNIAEQYWRDIVKFIAQIVGCQHFHNIGQYWRYNIGQYWRYNIAAILFATQDIYSLLKLWQDIEIYKNIKIPGLRYPFGLKGL